MSNSGYVDTCPCFVDAPRFLPSVTSYAGVVTFGLAANSAVMPDPQAFMATYIAEIQQLRALQLSNSEEKSKDA